MEPHATGCTQCSEDGREDADESLENELPEVLLTVIHRNHSGIHFCVRHYVADRLVDGFLDKLAKKIVNELFHRQKRLVGEEPYNLVCKCDMSNKLMTKGDIDRLGERIGASKVVTDTDLEQLQEYRQSFQDSLSRVFSFVLKTARKIDKQCIVTYRVKRIDTIIEKLRRFRENENGEMRLSRMWDIGGCRCILNVENYDKLYLLHDAIIKEFESGGAKCKVTDHIKEPSKSGYTSLHIYVKDKITQKPIEIQIRNKAQHNWATLVEIVDLLYESKKQREW